MSYRSAKNIAPESVFSWWYVDNTQNLFLKDQYSPYLRNARLDWQSITIRPWHSLFATLTTWSSPKGIGSYLRSDPTNDVLVVRHNKDADEKLVTIAEDGTVTNINTGANITSDNRMFFQNVADVIYCMNGSDGMGKLSGTTYTVPSTGIASFSPSFSVVFGGSHWASGWSTNSNKVYKSVADNYEDFSSTWSDSFTFSEQIVGLSANLQALFYFTKNTISLTGVGDITDTAWTITYNTRSLNVKEWAVNNASIVEVGDATYFLSSSNAISKIARGTTVNWFDVLDLSARKYSGIDTIMSTLDKNQEDSFGVYLPDVGLIKWYVKSAWATFNDVCIVYDTIKDAFLVDTNKPFFDSVFFKGYTYAVSMLEPKVYQDEINQDDEDSAIEFEYWTKEFYLSDPTYKKILWESRTLLDINELAVLTQSIWIDWESIDSKTIYWTDNIDSYTWENAPDTWEDANYSWNAYGIVTPWVYKKSSGWIWVSPIGMHPVGMSADSLSMLDDDYQEIYILRTKGNLNTKGKKIQFRYINNSLAGKVRLKNIEMLVEVLPWLSSNLT